MGERDVDRIIEAWRSEARTAGESAPAGAGESRRRVGIPARLRRLGPLRLVAAGAALIVFVLVAIPVLTATSGGSPPVAPVAADAPAQPAGEPEAAGTAPLLDEWFSVLQRVDAARAAAYAAADPAGLETVFAAGGTALAGEQAALAGLRSGGLRAEGWRTDLLAVSPVPQDPPDLQRAVLRVTDERGAYDLVAADGSRRPVAAAPRAHWLVDMVMVDGAWVVAEVRPFAP